MRRRLLDWLACPTCRSTQLELTVFKATRSQPWSTAPDADPEEVAEGALTCTGCGVVYPVRGGVPRLLPDPEAAGLGSGHRWTRFGGAEPEFEANFADMTSPARPNDFLGQLVLDAGCGFGRHTFYAARYGAEVVALDAADDAVAACAENCRGLASVHVVQGDVYRPPLRQEVFDRVLAFGLLHHLARPHEAFHQLRDLVRSGGVLQVWVVGPRQGALAVVSGALRGAANAMSDEGLHALSIQLARVLRVVSHTPFRFLHGVPVVHTVVSHLPAHDHHRWPFDVVVADVYDRLRVPYTCSFTGEELERWFVDAGFADLTVTRRVRNTESFRGMGTRR